MDWASDNGYCDIDFTRLGVPDRFVEHGSVDELHAICGLDEKSIEEAILSRTENTDNSDL